LRFSATGTAVSAMLSVTLTRHPVSTFPTPPHRRPVLKRSQKIKTQ
jgi:hypothetical protein